MWNIPHEELFLLWDGAETVTEEDGKRIYIFILDVWNSKGKSQIKQGASFFKSNSYAFPLAMIEQVSPSTGEKGRRQNSDVSFQLLK